MKRIFPLIIALCALLLLLASCSHEHTGGESCTDPAICEICGKEYGEPLGHDMGFVADSTTHTRKCMREGCNESESRSSHFGGTATCGAQAVCVYCGFGYGDTPEHTYVGHTCTTHGTCSECGASTEKLLPHDYVGATCTELGKCTMCGQPGGNLISHNYVGATCTELGKCTMCGQPGGSFKNHYYDGETCAELGKCTMCGQPGGEYSDLHSIPAGGDYCSVCNMDYFSCNLKFRLNEDKDAYKVENIGFCERSDVIIPAEYRGLPVTAIGELAFWQTGITSVVIPDSVVTIEYGAFAECPDLTKITVPETLKEIGEKAFINCPFEEFDIPAGLTVLGMQAFAGCASLKSAVIPEAITTLDGTFYMCYALEDVKLHNKLEVLDNGAFYGAAFKSIALPDSVHTIGRLCFAGAKIEQITFGSGIKTIGDQAFGATSLKSITIPGAVKTVPNFLFYECPSLTSVVIEEGVKHIGKEVFEKCPLLTDISVPSTVISCLSNPFAGSEAVRFNVLDGAKYLGNADSPYIILVSADTAVLNVPDTTTVIAEGVCLASETLTTLIIGKGVVYIGRNAFASCNALTSITVNNENTVYMASGNCLIEKETKTLLIYCNTSVIPADGSVTYISGDAFQGLTKLEYVYVPGCIESGYLDIQNCANLKGIIIANGAQNLDFTLCINNGDFDVFFEGTAAQWASTEIINEFVMDAAGNEIPNQFVEATKYFYSEATPTESGNYWHYVDGVPQKWENVI